MPTFKGNIKITPFVEGVNSKCFYYVTCMDAGRVGVVAGPWNTYAEAKSHVNKVQGIACEHNEWAWFYAWGVSGSDVELSTVFDRSGIKYRDVTSNPTTNKKVVVK